MGERRNIERFEVAGVDEILGAKEVPSGRE
jgi:hypothetical protein